MKEKYDKRHNVKEPDFQIGQNVLLSDRRIKADSNRVLTHKPYSGPYIIKDVIQTDPSIGPAYKLVHELTGKPVNRLVNFDRLKLFNANSPNLDVNSPSRLQMQTSDEDADDSSSHRHIADSKPEQQKQTAKKMPPKPRFQRAVKILKERRNKGVRQFLVLFVDQTSDWTSNVSPGLLHEYENRRRMKIKAIA